jgi:hypothetical protein
MKSRRLRHGEIQLPVIIGGSSIIRIGICDGTQSGFGGQWCLEGNAGSIRENFQAQRKAQEQGSSLGKFH